ncbi:MAG: flagellar brake protein [Marinobacterium sp.]|nr:flagellar brake protein [Marinobacterium sp.]
MNNALAVERSAVTLTTLKPPIGTRLQLECPGSKERLSSQLLGYMEGSSVMVATPQRAGKPLPLKAGIQVTVRMITGTSICGFSTRLLCCYDSPAAHWHLAWPDELTHKRIRQHTRVPVNLVASVDEFIEGSLDCSSGWPRNLLCQNLSQSGANLLSKQPLGRPDDRLYLTLRLQVAGFDQVVMVPGIIRNVSPRTADYQYGVEFFDLDEDARLVLAGFVYQQCLLETGYRDYLAEVM